MLVPLALDFVAAKTELHDLQTAHKLLQKRRGAYLNELESQLFRWRRQFKLASFYQVSFFEPLSLLSHTLTLTPSLSFPPSPFNSFLLSLPTFANR